MVPAPEPRKAVGGCEERLEFGDGLRLVALGRQPALERLLEPLDFPAGRGVVGPGVLLGDTEAAQLGLQAVAAAFAAGEAGGEDHAVVGQGGCGGAEAVDGIPEGDNDAGPGDAEVGGDAEGEAVLTITQT